MEIPRIRGAPILPVVGALLAGTGTGAIVNSAQFLLERQETQDLIVKPQLTGARRS
jgi:hypothetical protein